MEEIFKPSISEENGLKNIKDSDMNILSVGISTGGSAEIKMIENNSSRHVIATTIDNEGLEFTRKIIDEKGLSGRIEIKYEDVSKKMPYDNEHFHYIYARLVLQYLNNEDLEKALKELNRVMKKHGRMLIVVRSSNDWEAFLEGTMYDENTGITVYPDYRTLNTDTVKYVARRLHTKESITSFLKNAGFNICYIKEYKEQLYHDYMRKEKVKNEGTIIEVLVSK